MKSVTFFFLSLVFGLSLRAQSFDLTTQHSILTCNNIDGVKVSSSRYEKGRVFFDSNYVYVKEFPVLSDIHILYRGYSYVAIDSVGQLWVKGQNNFDLGVGHSEPIDSFIPHPAFESVEDIATSADGLTIFCVSEGSLWFWGYGPYELFLDDTSLQGLQQNPVPVFPAITNATDMSLGSEHSVFLLEDGTLWGWGSTNEGRLANKYTGYIKEPRQLGIKNIKQVEIGLNHTVILDSNGVAYAFGINQFGECGVNPEQAYFVQDPNAFPIDNVKKVAASRLNTYLLRENGDLYAAGTGIFGGMGNGDSTWVNFDLVKVSIPEPIEDLRLSKHGAMAKAESGNFYAFGLDVNGEFGQNKTGYNQYTPVLIDPSCTTVDVAEHTTSTLTVSPNPSQDGLFSLSGFETSIPWKVYSVLGHRVASGTGSKVDLSRQPSGMYLLTAGEARVKLVVE